MKKIYLAIAAFFAVSAISAQTVEIITDGGFEAAWYPGSALGINSPNIFGTSTSVPNLDWVGIMKKETTNPISGANSALVENVDDQVAAETIWGAGTNPKTSGYAEFVYEGDQLPLDPNQSAFTFKYEYTPAEVTPGNLDSAFVLVQIVDTTQGTNGVVLWRGGAFIFDATTGVTAGVVDTWQNTGTAGTANLALVQIFSSFSNYMYDVDAPAGTKLLIDDVSWTFTTVGVNEANENIAKVYPNPAVDELNVEAVNGKNIAIYNVDGTLVKSVDLNGVTNTINVANLTAGMYVYVVTTENGVVKNTFVKQ